MLRDDGTSDTFYIATDHLGSSDVILKNSAVHVYTSFDAFGQRRDPTDWTSPIKSGDWPKIKSSTRRGLTGHEHLDNVGLIHMNGRVQDPVVGRFLSADPFVQAPHFSESLNRYSYTFNSPLSYTDPSGFESNPYRYRIDSNSWGLWFEHYGSNYVGVFGISNAELRGGAGAGSGNATFNRPNTANGQPDVQDFTVSKADNLSGGWRTASFSIGIEVIAGGNPFPVGGPFAGGGSSVGFNSAGQIYYKFTAKAGGGNWAFAGVSPVTSFGVSSDQLPIGVSTERLFFTDVYFGAGEAIGYGATYSSDGLSFNRSIRFPGKGYGGAVVAGGQIDTYVASPPLILYYIQGANAVGDAITQYSRQSPRHVMNSVYTVLSWFGMSE